MLRFENPFTDIAEATDAMAKMITLQKDLFVLTQELKTLRQLKRTLWLGAGLITLNLLLFFTFFWIQMSLHEAGWSAVSLAIISALFFGLCAGSFIWIALKTGARPTLEKPQ
jgi:hypothetical protein